MKKIILFISKNLLISLVIIFLMFIVIIMSDIEIVEEKAEVNVVLKNDIGNEEDTRLDRDIDMLHYEDIITDVTIKHIICIDPGHQLLGNFELEPISPYSSQMKIKVSEGTKGAVSGTPEHEINLQVAMLLKEKLIEKGFEVIMTRETSDVNISNKERASISNNSKADIFIRLHADYSIDKKKRGISVLYPLETENKDAEFFYKSKMLGSIILDELLISTGTTNGEIIPRSDITGFNWSYSPVVLIEMGFMSNKDDDTLLNSVDYQHKLVAGIISGIQQYLDKFYK